VKHHQTTVTTGKAKKPRKQTPRNPKNKQNLQQVGAHIIREPANRNKKTKKNEKIIKGVVVDIRKKETLFVVFVKPPEHHKEDIFVCSDKTGDVIKNGSTVIITTEKDGKSGTIIQLVEPAKETNGYGGSQFSKLDKTMDGASVSTEIGNAAKKGKATEFIKDVIPGVVGVGTSVLQALVYPAAETDQRVKTYNELREKNVDEKKLKEAFGFGFFLRGLANFNKKYPPKYFLEARKKVNDPAFTFGIVSAGSAAITVILSTIGVTTAYAAIPMVPLVALAYWIHKKNRTKSPEEDKMVKNQGTILSVGGAAASGAAAAMSVATGGLAAPLFAVPAAFFAGNAIWKKIKDRQTVEKPTPETETQETAETQKTAKD
jgi:hypothetical protein